MDESSVRADILPRGGSPAAATWLRGAWQGWPGLLAICTAGATMSWLATGHLVGRGNNIFHLSLLADLASLPGMADDAFVQSMSRFQSVLWLLLTGSDAWVPAAVSLSMLLFLDKALTLWALVGVAGELGLRGRARQAAFVLMMACTPLLRGAAYAGHGGLFIDYVSHSELAAAFSLLLWWACLRRRFDVALGLNGMVFALNGFMAVWNIAPLLWLALDAWRADPGLLRRQWRGAVAGLAVAAALAAPVLWRAVTAGQLGTSAFVGAAGLDHRQFLREYFPYHFLAAEMPLSQWLGLALVLLVAALGLRALGPAARGLRQIGLAYGAVYLFGVVLPLVSASPVLLNLHLLRCSVYFHFVAAIALGVWLLRTLESADPMDRFWRAPWLAVTLLTLRPAMLALPLALLVQRAWPSLRARAPARLRPLALAIGAAATLGLVGGILAHRLREAPLQRTLDDWSYLGEQVRQATQPGDVIMLPLDPEAWQPPDAGSGTFQYHARRPVWVDDKRRAAVFWQPAYEALWQQRRRGQQQLADWPARLSYAREHGIAVVVDRCAGLPGPLARTALAHVGRLCAVRAAADAAPAIAPAPLQR